MEEIPNQERKIKTAEVVKILQSKGLDNPEAKKLFMDWTMQREMETEKGTPKDRIIFNMERADIYLAVGDKEGALNALEDALMQAVGESEKDLYNIILKKMAELSERV